MAKPLSKRIRKSFRGTAKSVGRRLDSTLPGGSPPAAVLTGAAIAGVAGVAGVAAAVGYLRRNREKAATFHVRANGEGWLLVRDGADDPVAEFRTKRKAVQAARKTAAGSAPSRLVIYTADGAEQVSHNYELVRDA